MAILSEAPNLVRAFFKQAEEQGSSPLFFDKTESGWQSLSYKQVMERVIHLASALIERGIMPGERVVLSAENSSDWAICDLAIMAAGAIVVPAYTSCGQRDYEYLISHSRASMVICQSGPLEQKMRSVIGMNADLKGLILIGPAAHNDIFIQAPIWALDALYHSKSADQNFQQRFDQLSSEDCCCIIYTSGTGGQPKGVMLTHQSIQANIDAARDLLKEGEADNGAVFLSLLPLSHAYEHTAGLHLPVQIGAQVWYCEGPEKIAANLAEVRPTLMTAVPRLYEVLHERISASVRAKGGISEKLFNAAVRLGQKRNSALSLSISEVLFNMVLDRLVRAKIRARFGGRLHFFVSGGAALNPHIGRFFTSLGVGILQGYGQTEASPLISANRPKKIKMESVGPAVKGVEVKIASDGEILARGACLMKGYWDDAQATKATLKNGWLHTGDLGSMDKDGYITITGRKKDMIVNSGGENIAPTRIESECLMQPEIDQIVVFGDKRPYLVAVIVPADQLLELSQDEIKTALKKAVDTSNQHFSGIEKIRKFIISEEKFTIENNKLTPTLKVKRHVVQAEFQTKLDQLYR